MAENQDKALYHGDTSNDSQWRRTLLVWTSRVLSQKQAATNSPEAKWQKSPVQIKMKLHWMKFRWRWPRYCGRPTSNREKKCQRKVSGLSEYRSKRSHLLLCGCTHTHFLITHRETRRILGTLRMTLGWNTSSRSRTEQNNSSIWMKCWAEEKHGHRRISPPSPSAPFMAVLLNFCSLLSSALSLWSCLLCLPSIWVTLSRDSK